MDNPTELRWRKSNRSVGQGACIELAPTGDEFAIRNSNRLDLGVITCSKAELTAFIGGAQDGDFDDLVT